MAPRLALACVLFLSAVAALGLGPPRARAECAAPHWAAHPLTGLSTTFPRTGGAIVIAMELEAAGSAPTAEPPPLTLVRGRRTAWPLTATSIAPGLFRVPFDAHVTRGIWTLQGLGAETRITVGSGALPGAPVRPAIREIRRVAAAGLGSAGTQRIEVRANLEFPVPEGVIASIVTWNTDASPAAWARASVGQREVVLFAEPGRCGATPEGWTPPPEGTLLARVAWVDTLGQVSPASDAIPVQ